MADWESSFTKAKENLESLLNIGQRLILSQVDRAISEIEKLINPDVYFANMLKAKYDALIMVGFSEKQAFELALKAVGETLKHATQKSGETPP